MREWSWQCEAGAGGKLSALCLLHCEVDKDKMWRVDILLDVDGLQL